MSCNCVEGKYQRLFTNVFLDPYIPSSWSCSLLFFRSQSQRWCQCHSLWVQIGGKSSTWIWNVKLFLFSLMLLDQQSASRFFWFVCSSFHTRLAPSPNTFSSKYRTSDSTRLLSLSNLLWLLFISTLSHYSSHLPINPSSALYSSITCQTLSHSHLFFSSFLLPVHQSEEGALPKTLSVHRCCLICSSSTCFFAQGFSICSFLCLHFLS